MSEDRPYEVSFKYYLPEHSDELYIHVNAGAMYSLLHEIDQHLRKTTKYEENPHPEKLKLAEDIREMIHDAINMNL